MDEIDNETGVSSRDLVMYVRTAMIIACCMPGWLELSLDMELELVWRQGSACHHHVPPVQSMSSTNQCRLSINRSAILIAVT